MLVRESLRSRVGLRLLAVLGHWGTANQQEKKSSMLVNLPPPKATRLVMAQCHTIQASYTNLDASVKLTERLTFA